MDRQQLQSIEIVALHAAVDVAAAAAAVYYDDVSGPFDM